MKLAFSLVELSIVLVILGLLTGGILSGQSLINAAELRAVTTEFQTFQTATNTFQDKYFSLPGDMINATQFWGRADNGTTTGQCANPITNTGSGTQTCNGNGNGKIGEWKANVTDFTGTYYETYRFWQQLENAGLIPQTYTGVRGSAAVDHSVIGQNVPKSKFSNGGWTLENVQSSNILPTNFNQTYDNYLIIGKASSNNATYNPIFTAEQAWNIDTKSDDGKPSTGKIVTDDINNCVQAANVNDFAAPYKLDDTAIDCPLMFLQVF